MVGVTKIMESEDEEAEDLAYHLAHTMDLNISVRCGDERWPRDSILPRSWQDPNDMVQEGFESRVQKWSEILVKDCHVPLRMVRLE